MVEDDLNILKKFIKQEGLEEIFETKNTATSDDAYCNIHNIEIACDLINEPPSLKYPERIVDYIKEHDWKNFDLHIFDHKELKKLGCNLLLAVGIGSDYPPYMVILTPKNPPK